ncbi:hypothetical protein GCM10028808_73520 [Spirosoma migulaei]
MTFNTTLQAALLAIETPVLDLSPKPLTVSHILETNETDELDYLIGREVSDCCFEFNDINHKGATLQIEYRIEAADNYKEIVKVATHPEMTMPQLAELLIKAIKNVTDIS